jgi:peptidoglycan hydrolase-like protein with peptidoglycan-binding domain
MRGHLISKITSAVIVFLALSYVPVLFAGGQAKRSGTAKKPSVTKKKFSSKARVTKRRRARQRAQKAPTPQRISEIQSALATQGAYKGQPNGKWDAATVQAMKNFQSSHGLTATGKLDAPTLQKLGLGSEIAGRAAPLPLPDSPGSNGSNPQQTP